MQVVVLLGLAGDVERLAVVAAGVIHLRVQQLQPPAGVEDQDARAVGRDARVLLVPRDGRQGDARRRARQRDRPVDDDVRLGHGAGAVDLRRHWQERTVAVQVQRLRYSGSHTEAQIQRLTYEGSNIAAQIQWLKYRGSNTEAQIQRLKYSDWSIATKIERLKHRLLAVYLNSQRSFRDAKHASFLCYQQHTCICAPTSTPTSAR